jgi:hypothetical protein
MTPNQHPGSAISWLISLAFVMGGVINWCRRSGGEVAEEGEGYARMGLS